MAERRDRALAQPESHVRYFFNVKDGKTVFDEEGVECEDLSEARTEALRTSAEMLSGLHSPTFWTGEPWCLWVTDKPKGEGNTILSLTFTASPPTRSVS